MKAIVMIDMPTKCGNCHLVEKKIDEYNMTVYYCPLHKVHVDEDVDICEKLYQHKYLSREQIMKMFEINPRQYSFYISAGMYLGLINNEKSKQKSLNQIGTGIFSLDIKERNLAIVKLILQHKPFHDTYRFYLNNQRIPNSNEIFYILKQNKIYNVNSDVTLKRRATSVRSLIKCIVNLYD